MKRVLVNGLVVAVIVAAPLAGHSVLSGIRGGLPTAFASNQDLDQTTPGFDDQQVTPAATTPRATATPAPAAGAAPAQGTGKTPAQTPGKAPDQAPKAGAPAQAPKPAAAAPAQAPKAAAAPAQVAGAGTGSGQQPTALPRTGGVPFEALALVGTAILGAGAGLRRLRR